MSDKPNGSSKIIAETTVETTAKVDSSASSTKEKAKTTTRKRTTRAKSKTENNVSKGDISTELKTDAKSLIKKDSDNENKKIDIDTKKIVGVEVEEKVSDKPLENEKVEKKTRATKKTTTAKKTTTKTRTTRKTTKASKTSSSTKADTDKAENKEVKADSTKKIEDVKGSIQVDIEETKIVESKNDKSTAMSKESLPSAKEIITEKDKENIDDTEITSFNEYLFHQGKNYSAYNILGSHVVIRNNVKGVQFATWAPRASEVYVVGDFNDFNVNDAYKLE